MKRHTNYSLSGARSLIHSPVIIFRMSVQKRQWGEWVKEKEREIVSLCKLALEKKASADGIVLKRPTNIHVI